MKALTSPLFFIGIFVALCILTISNYKQIFNTGDETSEAIPPKPHTVEFLSQPYRIDKQYKSMEGPFSTQIVSLSDSDTAELLWITGYHTMVVAEDGVTPVSQEFLCHNNLDFRPGDRAGVFNSTAILSSRIFTLSQGVFSIEMPAGFGIPVMSNQTFNLTTQVLNHNIENPNINVRHRVVINYVRDQDIKGKITPLFPANAFVAALLDAQEGDNGYYGIRNANSIQQGATCLPGTHAGNSDKANVFKDLLGKKFSGHWVVKLGREERRTLVTKIMNIPYDTRVHYIAVHVHPFSESLELRDLTTGQTVFKSTMTGPKDRIGLTQVDSLVSQEGIPVFKDHEYELVSVYNNTSGVEQDAMATMIIYLQDKTFESPD